MLTELKPQEYDKAIPLFEAIDYSLSLPAAFAGNNPGRVFVDDPINPSVAFALTIEGTFLAGDPNDKNAVEQAGYFLRDQIFTGNIYLDNNTNLSLALDPIGWELCLPEMISTHEIEKLPRYHYLCQKLRFNWQVHLPSEYQVRSFDQNLLNDPSLVIPKEISNWASIKIHWGSMKNFKENGVSTCVMHENKVVTICSSDCFAEDQIDIGILTLPQYRHQGLAAVAAAANIETAFNKGYRKIGWHCNTDNIGSWKTAEKVGFKHHRTYFYYFYVFDKIDHWAALGWFYFKQKQFKKTIDYYERVFDAREDNPDYYYHLTAVAWAALSNTEMSIHYLNTAVDHGWRDRDWTEQEAYFRFLHDSPQWLAVLNRMST